MDKKKSIVLYLADLLAVMGPLKNSERGVFITALCNKNYFGDYKIKIKNDTILMGLSFIQNDIDINNQKYTETIEKRRSNGSKGGKKRAENAKHHLNSLEANTAPTDQAKPNLNEKKGDEECNDYVFKNKNKRNTEKENKGNFAGAPTVDEVAIYCQESGYTIDPYAFVRWNEERGWMNGKKYIALDWRKAVRKWYCKENGLEPSSMETMGNICQDLLGKIKGAAHEDTDV